MRDDDGVTTVEVPDFPSDADVREDVGAMLALDVASYRTRPASRRCAAGARVRGSSTASP
jgi:hypothetical protein